MLPASDAVPGSSTSSASRASTHVLPSACCTLTRMPINLTTVPSTSWPRNLTLTLAPSSSAVRCCCDVRFIEGRPCIPPYPAMHRVQARPHSREAAAFTRSLFVFAGLLLGCTTLPVEKTPAGWVSK